MFQNLFVRLLLLATLAGLSGCRGEPQPAARTVLAPQAHVQSCADHFLAGRAPRILNAKLARDTNELCFHEFSVMHSGVTRTPLWSAEHLDPANIVAAQQLSRENSFHAETRLPADERAELADYARSGYDRGHMAPNGDMSDRDSQHDSFSLANIVPQDGENNRHLWAAIEGAVRKMVKREGDLYVVTGPAFLSTDLKQVGKVLVPTHLYKLVWSAHQNAGAAWFVENTPDAKPEVMSIPELERRIGIDLLPAVGAADKDHMLRLPNITAATHNARKKKS
jgi:endonuclease G